MVVFEVVGFVFINCDGCIDRSSSYNRRSERSERDRRCVRSEPRCLVSLWYFLLCAWLSREIIVGLKAWGTSEYFDIPTTGIVADYVKRYYKDALVAAHEEFRMDEAVDEVDVANMIAGDELGESSIRRRSGA